MIDYIQTTYLHPSGQISASCVGHRLLVAYDPRKTVEANHMEACRLLRVKLSHWYVEHKTTGPRWVLVKSKRLGVYFHDRPDKYRNKFTYERG